MKQKNLNKLKASRISGGKQPLNHITTNFSKKYPNYRPPNIIAVLNLLKMIFSNLKIAPASPKGKSFPKAKNVQRLSDKNRKAISNRTIWKKYKFLPFLTNSPSSKSHRIEKNEIVMKKFYLILFSITLKHLLFFKPRKIVKSIFSIITVIFKLVKWKNMHRIK